MSRSHHLERLGRYFVYHNIHERFNITFERFVDMVRRDVWDIFIKEHQQVPGYKYVQNPKNF